MLYYLEGVELPKQIRCAGRVSRDLPQQVTYVSFPKVAC